MSRCRVWFGLVIGLVGWWFGWGIRSWIEYLEFVAARARPNMALATGYDLKVFFRVLSKDPVEVTTADVLGFITARRRSAHPEPSSDATYPGDPDGLTFTTSTCTGSHLRPSEIAS
jgi:hypothetical protein